MAFAEPQQPKVNQDHIQTAWRLAKELYDIGIKIAEDDDPEGVPNTTSLVIVDRMMRLCMYEPHIRHSANATDCHDWYTQWLYMDCGELNVLHWLHHHIDNAFSRKGFRTLQQMTTDSTFKGMMPSQYLDTLFMIASAIDFFDGEGLSCPNLMKIYQDGVEHIWDNRKVYGEAACAFIQEEDACGSIDSSANARWELYKSTLEIVRYNQMLGPYGDEE